MSLLLLTMIAIGGGVLGITRSVSWQKHRALIVAGASMLALLIAFRAMVPTPFHEDFRHIFPVLVPSCLLYAKAVERLSRWSGRLCKAGIAIGVLMIASSVLFFVRIP
jgi:flagellar motor component MotA